MGFTDVTLGPGWSPVDLLRSRFATRRAKEAAPERLVIVGNGMVGQRLCERLVELGAASRFAITVLAEEARPAYDRIHLGEVLGGRPAQELWFRQPGWYQEHGISLRLADGVESIDWQRSTVTTSSGRVTPFDRLVLATGSRAVVPPMPAGEGVELIPYRTLDDVERVLASAQKCRAQGRPIAVIGGGLLGVEAARSFQRLGVGVVVFEAASQLLPRQLDAAAAEVLQVVLAAAGLDIRLRRRIVRIEAAGDGTRIDLDDGSHCVVGGVVVAAGVRASDELAARCGLRCHPRGGVEVDSSLVSSRPRVYAVGECASHQAVPHGLVAPGYAMADVLAANLMGARRKLSQQSVITRLKLDLTEVTVLGDPVRVERDAEHIWRADGCYRKLVTRGGRVVAVVSIGAWNELPVLQELVARGAKVALSALRRLELEGQLGLERARDVGNLPDAAVVCQCANVTCGTLRGCIKQGLGDVEALSRATQAGTLCGSCRPQLVQLCGGAAAAPAASGRLFPAAAIAALLLASATLVLPRVRVATSVLAEGVDVLFTNGKLKQVTGFSVLGLVGVGLLFSLRKRAPGLFRWSSYARLRVLHGLLGALALAGLWLHTGFRLGANLNLCLMTVFLVSSLTGAAAGLLAATTDARRLAFSRVLRRCHELSFWPLPVLTLFHVLASYYF